MCYAWTTYHDMSPSSTSVVFRARSFPPQSTHHCTGQKTALKKGHRERSSNHDKFVSPSRRDAVARPRQACQEIRPYNGGQWWWSIRPYKEIKNHEGLLTKKMRFGMDMNGWSLPKIASKFRDSVPSTSMFQVPVPGPARKNRRCLIFQVSDWHCTWLDTVPSNWEGFGWSPESVYIYIYTHMYTMCTKKHVYHCTLFWWNFDNY